MNKWLIVIMCLIGFVAKALIYQAQGKMLECLVCLAWFTVVNHALGAVFPGIEKYHQQKRRREYFRREFDRRNDEPEEEEDNEC